MFATALSIFLAATDPAQISPSASTSYSCGNFDGIDRVLDQSDGKRRFIIVGEAHGTVQVPLLFEKLVCNASSREPVNVLLELRKGATAAVQRYVASDGSPGARRALFDDEIWDPKWADGRSSEAIFKLVEALRGMKHSGLDIEVYCTQPDDRPRADQFYGEVWRAADWALIAAQRPNALNLILVGSAHAALNDNRNLRFLPAAAHLRPSDVLAIGPFPEGGAQWGLDISPSGKPLMGVHALPGKPADRPGIVMLPDASSGWNAHYAFGEPAQPSPPMMAKPEASSTKGRAR